MIKSYAASLVRTTAPSKCPFCPCTPLLHVESIPLAHMHNFAAWATTALALFKGKAPTYIDFQSTT